MNNEFMKSRISLVCRSLIMYVLAGSMAIAIAAPKPEDSWGKVVYRYKNAQGITVMDSSIPPEYVSKGYEILSLGGKILKVVPPALVGEAAEKAREERIRAEELAKT